MAEVTLFVLDPSKLPGAPETFPKGWGAADWDAPDDVDVLAALRGAVVTAATPDAVALVSIDPTYPAAIQLPAAIIALEPGHGIPLPAGEVGILAGQGGERKSTLTIQMAIAAAAAEDGALVSPFTGRAVDPDDPFQVGGGLAVRGGPACMASWEDAAPWLALRARACAEHLDRTSGSTRHTRVLTDAARLASVQMGYGDALFGITAADDRYALPHILPAGWDRLWGTVQAVQSTLVVIDPINLAAVWTGYGPNEVGAFICAIKHELGSRAAALLVGHTGKAAAKVDEPSAIDILGSGAWKDRARCAFIARAANGHIELHLVKANYAPQRAKWTYTATTTGALEPIDVQATQRAADAKIDADVLKHMPTPPKKVSKTALTVNRKGGKGDRWVHETYESLRRLQAADHVVVNEKGEWSIGAKTGGEG